MKFRTLTPDLSDPPAATTPEPAPTTELPSSSASTSGDLSQLAAATQRESAPINPGFELVLGPMQVTSLAFVLLVVVVLCGGVAYAIGKAGSRTTPAPIAPTTIVRTEPPPQSIQVAPIASIIVPTTPHIPTDGYASLFGTPAKGQLYIQMGAVDRGMAIVFAQGLEKMGFKSTIIPGPVPKIFRVIAGPFASATEFNAAKQILDNLGLDTFARRFDDPEPPAVPTAVSRPAASSTIAP